MDWKWTFFFVICFQFINGTMICNDQGASLTSLKNHKILSFGGPLYLSLSTPNVTHTDSIQIKFDEITEVDEHGQIIWSFHLNDGINSTRDCSYVKENGKEIGEQVSYQMRIPRMIQNQLEWIEIKWIYTLYYDAFVLSIWNNQNISIPSGNIASKLIISNFRSQNWNGRLQINIIAGTGLGVLDFGEFVNPTTKFIRGIRTGYSNTYLPDFSQICTNGTCTSHPTAIGYDLMDKNPPRAKIWLVPIRDVDIQGSTAVISWGINFWDPPVSNTNYNAIILAVSLLLGFAIILSVVMFLFYRHYKLTQAQIVVDENRNRWLESQLTDKEKNQMEEDDLKEKEAFNEMKARLKL